MPPLILLEGITRVKDGCVPTKVTGRYPVCDAGHEWRRPTASSGREVVRRRNSRAPLSHLHWDYESLRALPASRSTAGAGAGTSRDRVRTIVVVGLGHMPKGRQSPKHALPRGMTPEQVTREIGPRISAMDEAIAQCESRFGEQNRLLDHPILGPLTGRQWRKFHWVHGRHHIKQIQSLRQQS